MLRKLKTTEDDDLTSEERKFLREARKKYKENTDWFEFEDYAFGMRSPLFSRNRSHIDVLGHPLYIALKEMWLDLGERQGRIASAPLQKETHATRRKTTKSRPSDHGRNATKKRDMASAGSSPHKRLSKS